MQPCSHRRSQENGDWDSRSLRKRCAWAQPYAVLYSGREEVHSLLLLRYFLETYTRILWSRGKNHNFLFLLISLARRISSLEQRNLAKGEVYQRSYLPSARCKGDYIVWNDSLVLVGIESTILYAIHSWFIDTFIHIEALTDRRCFLPFLPLSKWSRLCSGEYLYRCVVDYVFWRLTTPRMRFSLLTCFREVC